MSLPACDAERIRHGNGAPRHGGAFFSWLKPTDAAAYWSSTRSSVKTTTVMVVQTVTTPLISTCIPAHQFETIG